MPNYSLLKDAYYGEGGFLDGSYLSKHKRETTDNYMKRREFAYYNNYFAAIVNALVDPIFRKTPLREWDGPAATAIETFTKNVDNAGTDIQSFMAAAAVKAKMLGACFICMDASPEVSPTLGDALAKRNIPYAYIVEPEFVTDWAFDNYGNLAMMEFKEPVEAKESDIKWRRIKFTATEITITNDSEQPQIVPHTLGRIPVIFFPARLGSRQTAKPASEMEPLAKCVLAQYNYQSYLGEILRNQTFSILTMPGSKPSAIEIGTNNALCYDPDVSQGSRPEFIAPPSDPANTLIAQIKAMTEEMYRMAGLSFVTGTKQEASGVSKAWEFERTNQCLANFARRCRSVEIQLLNLFMLWIKQDGKYDVQYANDFGIVDVAAEIQTAQSVLDLNLMDDMKKQVLKKVIAAYLPDISDEDYDELMAAYDKQARETDYNNPPPPNNPTGNNDGNGDNGNEGQ